jgi:hypothetical protein
MEREGEAQREKWKVLQRTCLYKSLRPGQSNKRNVFVALKAAGSHQDSDQSRVPIFCLEKTPRRERMVSFEAPRSEEGDPKIQTPLDSDAFALCFKRANSMGDATMLNSIQLLC